MTNRFCVLCGGVLQEGAAFCISCGHPIQPTTLTMAPQIGDNEFELPDNDATVVAEQDDLLNPLPAPVGTVAPGPSMDDPALTILEEAESIPALLRLEIDDDQTGSSTIEFELWPHEQFTLGRDGAVSDFVPVDPRSSRRHFRIAMGPEGYTVEDLGSSNGTFVNGVRVQGALPVRSGNSIEYGRSSAVFHVVRDPDPWPVND